MVSLWNEIGRAESLYSGDGYAKGSRVTFSQFVQNFNTTANSRVTSKLFTFIIKSLSDFAKDMYSTRAFFRTGNISRELKKYLKITEKTLSLRVPPYNKDSAFHFQETGFTSRGGNWIPGRFFFREIIYTLKSIFYRFCNYCKFAFEKVFAQNGGKVNWSLLSPEVIKIKKILSAELDPINEMIKQRNIRRSKNSMKNEKSWRRNRGLRSNNRRRNNV